MSHPTARALLAWYAESARDLPWRRRRDPYAIWVAEIMLQQTRVETVIPYYERWLTRFPSIEALAEADTDAVLRHWEGLGYYHRAHHLHKAARLLVEQYRGQLPQSIKALEALPGIGAYTAAAIAALAFDIDAIALDGNLRRVIARILDLDIDPRLPGGERIIRDWAEAMLPKGQASAFNQALMDLGATVCLPRAPRCSVCPIQTGCLAFERGTQLLRPVRKPKKAIPQYQVAAGVLIHKGKILLGRRPADKLLGGLWEFPGGKQEAGENLESCLQRELREELDVEVKVGLSVGVFAQAYTHFRVNVHAFYAQILKGEARALDHSELAWVDPIDFENYPMGKIDRAIARTVRRDLR